MIIFTSSGNYPGLNTPASSLNDMVANNIKTNTKRNHYFYALGNVIRKITIFGKGPIFYLHSGFLMTF